MARDIDIERKSKRKERAEARRGRAAKSDGYEIGLYTLVELGALAKVFADAGGAIRIGKTRDGGALAIGCYMGDDYATEYIRPNEDMGQSTEEILAAWLPEKADDFLRVREALYGALQGVVSK